MSSHDICASVIDYVSHIFPSTSKCRQSCCFVSDNTDYTSFSIKHNLANSHISHKEAQLLKQQCSSAGCPITSNIEPNVQYDRTNLQSLKQTCQANLMSLQCLPYLHLRTCDHYQISMSHHDTCTLIVSPCEAYTHFTAAIQVECNPLTSHEKSSKTLITCMETECPLQLEFTSQPRGTEYAVQIDYILPIVVSGTWLVILLPKQIESIHGQLCQCYTCVENTLVSTNFNVVSDSISSNSLRLWMFRMNSLPKLVAHYAVDAVLDEATTKAPIAVYSTLDMSSITSDTNHTVDTNDQATLHSQILECSANVPNHVAIIMDGNGRWAQQQGLGRLHGHQAGIDAILRLVRTSRRVGISYLTIYAFSTQNWKRPRAEVDGLMRLLVDFLRNECAELIANGVRVVVNGDKSRLPWAAQRELDRAIELSKHNEDLTLCLALSYGGRDEIIHAAKKAMILAQQNGLSPQQLDEATFRELMPNPDIPDPDLLIRTSGEMRVSNFLLWHIAYTEIFVTKTMWPDFSSRDLLDALSSFGSRERRFGLTTAQVKDGASPKRQRLRTSAISTARNEIGWNIFSWIWNFCWNFVLEPCTRKSPSLKL